MVVSEKKRQRPDDRNLEIESSATNKRQKLERVDKGEVKVSKV